MNKCSQSPVDEASTPKAALFLGNSLPRPSLLVTPRKVRQAASLSAHRGREDVTAYKSKRKKGKGKKYGGMPKPMLSGASFCVGGPPPPPGAPAMSRFHMATLKGSPITSKRMNTLPRHRGVFEERLNSVVILPKCISAL